MTQPELDLDHFIVELLFERDRRLRHPVGQHAATRYRQAAFVTMFLDWFVHRLRHHSWDVAQASGRADEHSPWDEFRTGLRSYQLIVERYELAARIARGTSDVFGVDLEQAAAGAAPEGTPGGNASGDFFRGFLERVRAYDRLCVSLTDAVSHETKWGATERRENYSRLMDALGSLTNIDSDIAVQDFLFAHAGELDSKTSIQKMRQRLKEGDESAFGYVRRLTEKHVGIWFE